MTRLILISDSRQQWSGSFGSKTQAIRLFHDERYVALRKVLLEDQAPDIRAVIISAKYGFIDPDREIKAYSNTFTYEKVDKFLPALLKQWHANEDRWFKDVDDLFIAATGPHLYALQRVELMIKWLPIIDDREGLVRYMYQPYQVDEWIKNKLLYQDF